MSSIISESMNVLGKNQTALGELRCTIESVDHLESLVIDKIRFRRSELTTISDEYESAIQAYSNIILKLVEAN